MRKIESVIIEKGNERDSEAVLSNTKEYTAEVRTTSE